MVRLSDVKVANRNFVGSLTSPLVAVFVGGTSGTCQYALHALVSTTASVNNSNNNRHVQLRIYIVGRNQKAADETIAQCSKTCPSAKITFVQAKDLALLKDVDQVCAEITRLETDDAADRNEKPRIDLLVMSQAGSIFVTRKDTSEGLDNLMSLMYYSRMRFIDRLLPLLLESRLPNGSDDGSGDGDGGGNGHGASSSGGGGAHIISIYAPRTEGTLFPDDLSLRQPGHFTYLNARSHIAYFKTAFFETLVAKYPGKLSFSHVFPGLVNTPGFKNPDLPTWFKVVFAVVGRPLMWIVGTSHAENGARMLYMATPHYPAGGGAPSKGNGGNDQRKKSNVAIGADGKRGSGVYLVWNDNGTASTEKVYEKSPVKKEKLREMVWRHTTSAFEEIENGRVFEG
ncbi:hypothetical protein PV08_05453 [Exophiala spinifera]|uniref:Uncharacterized protein n=1 Tax=Exophiala spinifera TaxID=91928 RepID=A0A0D1ZRJ7_9EURO|nr:uncharacterized protein PV08_05453 [Exophiala spinifera]KIW15407.1 hypothetical protein PV08_05453 [Exophiala spinifera]